MAGFREPDPAVVQAHPGGSDDPLGESVLDPQQSWCRIFEPKDVRVVIGRHQNVHREVLVASCQQDGVPIHRRVSGGGAVVLAPGMLVLALRLHTTAMAVDRSLCHIAHAVCQAIQSAGGPRCQVCGHGDVAVGEEDGMRKVLGASIRQRRHTLYYLGVLLVADAVPLMERYLLPPSRRPDYRGNRDHAAFCTNLACHGLTTSSLAAQLRGYIEDNQPHLLAADNNACST
ncbi:MAG: hypothetical protein EA401_01945 [Planctomycetota bacterium]|nr:MAG: hypothetical protein EA401_01945 [Planctomycetota bacterium]